MRGRPLSIRLRIAAVSALVAALVLAVVALLVAAQVRAVASSTAGRSAADDLKSYAVDLRHQPQEGPDLPAAGLLVLVVAPDGVVRRDSMPPALARAARPVRAEGDVVVPGGRFRVVHETVRTSLGTWGLWAARDLAVGDALVRGVLDTVLVGAPLAVLATGLAAWLAAAGALRPVERLRTAAERLRGTGERGALPADGGGELVALAATLNRLVDDLRAAAAHERRVTADAAHELRTPLAVLAAQVELAVRHPELVDLDGIRTSTARLIRLTDDLLALSRADSAAADGRASAPVGRLLTEAMDAVDRARLLAPPGVVVDLEVDPALEESPTAGIDALAYGRILTNLLGNALAAGPASTVGLRLATSGGVLLTEVADDGPGVPEDFLPYAFDRFSRPQGRRSSASSGAGLGLALVRRLAEVGGGSAELRNAASGGAVATVRLPLLPDADRLQDGRESAQHSSPRRFARAGARPARGTLGGT